MWQRCGSHRGLSNCGFTLSKVNMALILIRQTIGRDGHVEWTNA
jgi:hypothetical protein